MIVPKYTKQEFVKTPQIDFPLRLRRVCRACMKTI